MNYPDDFINQVIEGDCLKVMKDIPDESVDLVIADPPFNVGKDYGKETDDSRSDYWKWLEERCREIYRVMSENSRLYIFNSDKGVFELKPRLEYIGFTYAQTLIWFGPNLVGGATRITGDWFHIHETILLLRKGKRTPMLKSHVANCFSVQTHVRPQTNFKNGRWHIAQKPLSLYIALISRTPGEIILDPFLGSGTTAIACKELGRRFIGIEINPEYCEIAEKRLSQEVLPFEKPKPQWVETEKQLNLTGESKWEV